MIGLSEYVLDASVGIKLLVNEDLSDIAESLFAEMPGNLKVRRYVPELFFVECANVLWKYVARHGYSKKDAVHNLSQLYALNLVSIPSAMVTRAALSIALELSISVYDACYAATSEIVKAPLVTADERLAKRLAHTKYEALYLGHLTA